MTAVYVWTPERDQVLRDRYDGRVRGRVAEIARLTGWPAWAIKKRAAVLGLSYAMDARDWTPEEEARLLEHAGTRSLRWIARQLARTETSVALKCKRMRISRAVREGYSLRELELCFGTGHKTIERWVREGKLVPQGPGRSSAPGLDTIPRRHGNGSPRDAWRVSDADLLRFIQAHPLAFELRRCDQVWFMDLITSGGLIRKALADERALEMA